MGGRGSGGERVGSGKKRKSDLEHAISGTPAARGVLLAHPSSTAIAPVEAFDPPASLRGKPLRVWHELAPHAFEARTLTPATAAAFTMLCRAVVRERALSTSKRGGGGPNHRGLMQRVGSWMKDFALAPLGKALYAAQPAQTVNPLDRFTKKAGA
jgi:hypothetical protein